MKALIAHARSRAHALSVQAENDQAFASEIAYDALPKERQLLAAARFRARHLRHIARLWLAFAEGAAS